MLTRICLSLAMLVAVPVWSQVEPAATGSPPEAENVMQTPPPVNGEAYPTITGAEMRSNELNAGLNFQTGYSDNVFGSGSTTPVADIFYSIGASIALDQMTPRLHQTYTYNSGFTLYQSTSARNESDQNALASFQYRLSPHISVRLADSFDKSTNIFNQPYGGVSGSLQSPTASVQAPFADQISNSASGELSYQFSSNGMVGGSGTSTLLNYLNPAQASGLSNSESIGGSAFYNLRLSSTQYIGMTYQYSNMTASSISDESVTRTHTVFFFYSVYLSHTLTLSASGGSQHFNLDESPLPAFASWTPEVTASIGWQRSHTNLAASYSRTIIGAGGLLGAFESNSANASVRWQLAREWTVGSTGTYAIQKNVLPTSISSSPGGHTVSGSVSIQHPMGERFAAALGYTRLHQSYADIPVISASPDSDREYISISYQLTRPLGR